jgi:S1-C subfamily serine protease
MFSFLLSFLLFAQLPIYRLENITEDSHACGTAFSYVNKDGNSYLVTAAHCTLGENPSLKVGDNKVTTIKKIFDFNSIHKDIAVLKMKSIDNIKPLKFSLRKPKLGELIYTYGYQSGMAECLRQEMIVMNPQKADISAYGIDEHVLVYKPAALPGRSGSPIFDKDGYVVGIVNQMVPGKDVGLGTTSRTIVEFINGKK